MVAYRADPELPRTSSRRSLENCLFHALLGCISANRDVSQCEPQAGTEYLYPNTHLARAPPRRRRASQARLLREGTPHNMGLVDIQARTKGWGTRKASAKRLSGTPH